MKILSFLLFCYFFIIISGCKLEYEDVSNHPEYAPLLSKRYRLKTEMLIYGINLPPGYGKDINVYSIKPKGMGSSGPEIITKGLLELGTILEVKSIKKSINSVLLEGKKVRAVVTLNSYKKLVDVPIAIDLKYLQSGDYAEKID